MAHPAPCPELTRRRRPSWLAVAAGGLTAFASLAVPGFAQETDNLAPANAPWAGGASDYFWWAERFDRVRFTNPASTYYFVKDPVVAESFCYLPPVPPPLGSEIPLFGTLIPNGPAASPRLAPHVLDCFYPMLGSALADGELSRPIQAQLEAYQAEKYALQEQVRTRLAELKEAEPAVRERQLAELAEEQAPRFAALEARAEKLRAELQRLHPLGGPPEARREADEVRAQPGAYQPSAAELEADALQLAAFYQEGLSAPQRLLLREASSELWSDARGKPAGTEAGARWLFFSPELARIRLPANLPALLEKSIADYSTLKHALMGELRGLLGNRALAGPARTDALKQLAIDQAPRMSAVEALAEDIRRGLAGLPEAAGPAPAPALPADLAARISAYRRHRIEALQTLHDLLARPGKGSVADFTRTQGAILGDLNRENAEIRLAVGEYVRGTGRPGDRKSIDDLLRDFEGARQEQESQARFRDYQAAVLQPGLSRDQRRVLFDAAVTQLALPLPAGQRIR